MARPPVTDWASDWDHLDPAWVGNPYPIWQTLRDGPGRRPRALPRRLFSHAIFRRSARLRTILTASPLGAWWFARVTIGSTRRRLPPIRPSIGRCGWCSSRRSRRKRWQSSSRKRGASAMS